MRRRIGRVATFPVAMLLAIPLVLAACGPGTHFHPGGVTVNPSGVGEYSKTVIGKRAPEALVAADGTICRVSPDRFRDTEVGQVVRCRWQ